MNVIVFQLYFADLPDPGSCDVHAVVQQITQAVASATLIFGNGKIDMDVQTGYTLTSHNIT